MPALIVCSWPSSRSLLIQEEGARSDPGSPVATLCAAPVRPPAPQCYAEKQALGLVPEELLDTGVNPAVFEIAGHMVLKRREDYEGITQGLAWRLLAEVSLSEERFQEVTQLCFGVGLPK